MPAAILPFPAFLKNALYDLVIEGSPKILFLTPAIIISNESGWNTCSIPIPGRSLSSTPHSSAQGLFPPQR